MLTRIVCQTTPRARSLQTKSSACNVLSPTSTSLLKERHRHQTRAYRFGIWSSYLDPEFQRELRRRHRMLKYKYADTVNRRLSWDNHPLAEDPRIGLKRIVARYWNPTGARCVSRFVDHDELSNRRAHTSKGSVSEDARSDFSSTRNDFWGNYDSWRSQLDQVVNNWTKQTTKGVKRANINTTSQAPRSNAAVKTHAQQSRPNTPIEEDYVIDPITNRKVLREPNADESESRHPAKTFKSYRSQFTTFAPPKIEEEQSPAHPSGLSPDAEVNKHAQGSKLDGWTTDHFIVKEQNVNPAIQSQPEHSNLQDPVVQSEGYSLNHPPPEEAVEQSDGLQKYETHAQEELHGKPASPYQQYDDLEKYRHSEFDDAPSNSAEVSDARDELSKYKPYMYHEGIAEQNSAVKHDDLDQYRPYKHQDVTNVDEPSKEYDDLDKYRSADFKDDFVTDQPFEQYGDLERYQSFRYQDLDGKAVLERDIVAESLKEFEDKESKESSVDPVDTWKTSLAERLRKLDLDSVPTEKSVPASFSTSRDSLSSGPEQKGRENLEQSMISHNEASDAADREASVNIQNLRDRPGGKTSSQGHRELTGNYVRDFPEEFSGSWMAQTSSSGLESRKETDEWGFDTTPKGLETAYEQERQLEIQSDEKVYSDGLANAANSSRLETALDRQQGEEKLEPALDRCGRHATKGSLSRNLERERDMDPYSKQPQGLETSYAEECEEGQPSKPYTRSYGGEPGQIHLGSTAKTTEPSERSDPPFEPFYPRDPEIDGIPSTFSSESTTETETAQKSEPVVYKILAYDPTMQNVSIAETTSVVPDQASPLSPAEVLLRLSNPSKFFPYFAPLQAEGFEIVSGGGDVLVFRQVRPGKTSAQTAAAAVNPIDMMGKPIALPNAAAFVSPTGFVNYDMPQVDEPQSSPPFRSNIDVRREEPVFSGPKSSTSEETPKQKKKKKKGRVARRVLLGGVWVAGVSYAIGIVSEFFITGGVDGKGPIGF